MKAKPQAKDEALLAVHINSQENTEKNPSRQFFMAVTPSQLLWCVALTV